MDISIHTFLAEGDIYVSGLPGMIIHFNPHLPCGRRLVCLQADFEYENISIHTFLAEGDISELDFSEEVAISIHTFLAEGDYYPILGEELHEEFQSTPSLRKATKTRMA